MAWQYTPFTLPLALAAVAALTTALYVVRRSSNILHTRQVILYLVLATGGFLWPAAYALQLSSTTLASKLLWNDVVWLGIALLAVSWVLFALDVAGVERVFRPHWIALVCLVPVTTLVGAWTNTYHHLLQSDVYLQTAPGGFVVLGFDPGPLFWVHLLVTYSLDGLTFAVLTWRLFGSSGVERRTIGVLLGVGLLPFAFSATAVVGVWPVSGVDPTPVLFSITSVVFGWMVVRHQLFDIVPTARRTVLEDLHDGIFVTDASRRVLDANRVAESVLGDDVDSLYGARLGVDVGPDGVSEAFDAPGSEVPVESTVDGESRVYDLRVDTVEDGFVGIFRDRTEARHAQQRFQTLIERTDTLVAVLDEDGTVQYASPSYGFVLGYDPAALEGTSGFDLIHPEDREETFAVLQKVLEDDRPREITVRVANAEGEWRDMKVLGQNLQDDPTIGGLVAWGTDVTEQRRYEQRLRVLNRVLRHDLRNDMNVVGGYASLLADHDDPDVARAAAIIDRKVGELTDLSEKARIVENSLTGMTQQETVDLVEVVDEQATSLGAAWPGASIRFDTPERALVAVHPLITSAVDNVLENAIEHTGGDEAAVDVRVTRCSVGGTAYYDLIVADEGPGIPETERAVIESESESSLKHSSGLGLWLVNWVITQSGGEFDVVDNEDGAAVRLRLPAAPSHSEDGSPSAVESEEGVAGI